MEQEIYKVDNFVVKNCSKPMVFSASHLLTAAAAGSNVNQLEQFLIRAAKNCIPHQTSIKSLDSTPCPLNNRTAMKRGTRRRHPATIQTPGRYIPTVEESKMEPLTNFMEPMTSLHSDHSLFTSTTTNSSSSSSKSKSNSTTESFNDRIVPDIHDPFYDDDDDELILGELELEEEELIDNSSFQQYLLGGGASDSSHGWTTGPRFRTISEASIIDERPGKTLLKSHELSVLTLFS